jgi:hypothetical protein
MSVVCRLDGEVWEPESKMETVKDLQCALPTGRRFDDHFLLLLWLIKDVHRIWNERVSFHA